MLRTQHLGIHFDLMVKLYLFERKELSCQDDQFFAFHLEKQLCLLYIVNSPCKRSHCVFWEEAWRRGDTTSEDQSHQLLSAGVCRVVRSECREPALESGCLGLNPDYRFQRTSQSCPSFLLYKVRLIVMSSTQGCCEDQWIYKHAMLGVGKLLLEG